MKRRKKPRILNSQAARVINKFGGARRLAESLVRIGKPRHWSVVYRWMYPRTGNGGGTGGFIPTGAWQAVLEAAQYEGIFITSEDMNPYPDEE